MDAAREERIIVKVCLRGVVGFNELRMLVSLMPTQCRGSAGHKGTNQHCERRNERGGCSRLACGVGCLAHLHISGFYLGDHVTDTFLGVVLRHSRTRSDEVCKITPIRRGNVPRA
jgi:hypothetical protein